MNTTTTQPQSPPSADGSVSAPRGYRSTEAGVIPDDWRVAQLSDFADIRRGASPRPINSPEWYDQQSAIGWVRIADIASSDGRYLRKTRDYLSSKGIARSRFLEPGSLIMSICATVGVPVITDMPSCIHDGFVVFGGLHGIRREFLFYVLKQLEPVFQSVGQTGSQNNLNTALVRNRHIALPPEPEQNAIAEALSDVDGLIGALDKLIAKKRAIKQAAMQQLLTDKTRLPGFSGKWDDSTLGEVAEIKNGATPSTHVAAFWNGAIRWCTPTDITGTLGKYLSTTERSITEAGLASCAASLLPPGALLLCSRATIGEVKIAATEICTNQGFKSLVCRTGVSNEFLYYLVLTLKPQMVERATGSTFLEIGKRDLASIPIKIPKEDEQRAIATVLSDIDAEIAALERRRDKTKQIKQGMMQQLLTGRVRLVKPQVSVAQASAESKGTKAHSWAFNEAVVISTLAKNFGSEQYPLGRKRYTKLSYLLHRHAEKQAEGYLKKAAGPYNPRTKYGGPERIAVENGYLREHKSGPYRGFVAADNITQADGYFEKWYGPECIQWLEQFRFKKNDELGLLATVDLAAEELRAAGKNIDVAGVKDVIRSHPQWKAKLDHPVFSDANIAKAISECQALFSSGDGETTT
ncbi:MAG: hypothetical protein GWP08_06205 [Nitrospiraceae bacterium]|nr:hypothetical protein [Nitrospiraceae bacterium]